MKISKTKEWLIRGTFTVVGPAIAIVSVAGLLQVFIGLPGSFTQGGDASGTHVSIRRSANTCWNFCPPLERRCKAAQSLITYLAAAPS
jgi:hypothetical protein